MLTEKEFLQMCEERGFVQSTAIYGADYNAQGDREPVKFVNQTAENETISDDEHIANDDKHPEYHATFTDSRENMWFVYYANGSMTARLYGKNYEESQEIKENPWIIAETNTFMRFDEYSKAYMQQSGNPDVAHVVIQKSSLSRILQLFFENTRKQVLLQNLLQPDFADTKKIEPEEIFRLFYIYSCMIISLFRRYRQG